LHGLSDHFVLPPGLDPIAIGLAAMTFVQVRFSFGAMEWQRHAAFPVAAQDGLAAAAVTQQSVAGSCAVKPRSHFALSGTSG
jgi:hypothetical protein